MLVSNCFWQNLILSMSWIFYALTIYFYTFNPVSSTGFNKKYWKLLMLGQLILCNCAYYLLTVFLVLFLHNMLSTFHATFVSRYICIVAEPGIVSLAIWYECALEELLIAQH